MPAKKSIRAALLLALLCAVSPSPAQAHSIHIFGWTADGSLHTFSYITRDKPLLEGQVEIKTADGRVLAQGKPDRNGLFSVPLSAMGTEKKIMMSIDLGDGHRAEFTLDME